MIQFLSREDALKKNTVLASYVKEMQDSVYAPDLFEPGENWVEEEEKWVELSEEKCAERNKEILSKHEKVKDKLASVPKLSEFTEECILSSRGHGRTHVEILANELKILNEKLNWRGMLFIPEFPYSWLEFLNTENKEQNRVAEWFMNKGVDKNFNGGVYASGMELKEFFQLLMQFISRNQDFPLCRFAGVDSSAIGIVCKYGNIHYLFYKNDEYSSFVNMVNNTKLEEIPFGACDYKY